MTTLLQQARELRDLMSARKARITDTLNWPDNWYAAAELSSISAFLDAVIDHLEKCRHVLPSGLSFPNQQHQQRTHTLALIAAVLYAPDLNRPAQDVVADAEELLAEVEKRAKETA